MPFLNLSFAKKKIIVNKTKFWSILALVAVVLFFDIWWLVVWALNRKRWSSITVLNVLLSLPILVLVIWLVSKTLHWLEDRLDARMDSYQHNWEVAELGNSGEDIVYVELQKLLNPDHNKIYRNVKLPGMTADLDMVSVGTKGITIFEIKNYDNSRIVYTSKDNFYKSREGKLVIINPDLRSVMSWRAKQLEKYLAEKGADNISIRKAIIYLNTNSVELKEYGGNPNNVYIAKGLEGLRQYITNSRIDQKFTPDFCNKVCVVLNNAENKKY